MTRLLSNQEAGFIFWRRHYICIFSKTFRHTRKTTRRRGACAEILLLYNGLHATIDYRIAHWLHIHGICAFSRVAISQWSKLWTGIEIHPGAKIGRRLVIDHGTGIVIGETAEIGDDCLLYQGVTLGGTGKDVGKRHPTLGNNVMVGCRREGAWDPLRSATTRASRLTPSCCARCRTMRRSSAFRAGSSGISGEKLDHIHTPDPVMIEIEALKQRLAALESAQQTRE